MCTSVISIVIPAKAEISGRVTVLSARPVGPPNARPGTRAPFPSPGDLCVPALQSCSCGIGGKMGRSMRAYRFRPTAIPRAFFPVDHRRAPLRKSCAHHRVATAIPAHLLPKSCPARRRIAGCAIPCTPAALPRNVSSSISPIRPSSRAPPILLKSSRRTAVESAIASIRTSAGAPSPSRISRSAPARSRFAP